MDSMEESESEPPPPSPPLPSLSNLIASLEQAALMAKQLPSSTSDPTHLHNIYSTLYQAHQNLSTFLSTAQVPAAENSLSSAAVGDPMEFGDEGIGEETVDWVEEQMRDCFIRNKRPKKRQLSPSAAAAVEEERRRGGGEVGSSVVSFDPHATRVRALELVYQFHG